MALQCFLVALEKRPDQIMPTKWLLSRDNEVIFFFNFAFVWLCTLNFDGNKFDRFSGLIEVVVNSLFKFKCGI